MDMKGKQFSGDERAMLWKWLECLDAVSWAMVDAFNLDALIGKHVQGKLTNKGRQIRSLH